MLDETRTREPSRPDRCPMCEGRLLFYLRTLPTQPSDSSHRVYRCDVCSHFEWVAEPAGPRG